MTLDSVYIDKGVVDIPAPKYIETPHTVEAREKIIRNDGFLLEKGGIGFSILFSVGVTPPETGNITPRDCMREPEILETVELLHSGKKVLWEGGDGFGKSTFTGELAAILLKEEPDLKIINLTHNDFRTRSSMERQLERLEWESASDHPDKILYLLDSVDYLWEKIPPSLDNAGLAQLRIEFIQKLMFSDHKVVMTSHDVEPKNKEVDEYLKIRLNSHFNVLSVREKLSPWYQPHKVIQVLERVGFPHDLAVELVSSNQEAVCRHSTLVNYFFKQPNYQKETQELQFSLKRSLQFIQRIMETEKNPIQYLSKVFQSVFKARNLIRFQDWINIGY